MLDSVNGGNYQDDQCGVWAGKVEDSVDRTTRKFKTTTSTRNGKEEYKLTYFLKSAYMRH